MFPLLQSIACSVNRLAEILPLCWENIPPKQFEALWKSMPDRVQAVIDAKGWHTRF
jgi:hypothetical protein